MFDSKAKVQQSESNKTKSESKAKKVPVVIHKPYKITKDLPNFKVYEADEDYMLALQQTCDIIVHRHEVNEFADMPRYLNAADDEIAKLWCFENNELEPESAVEGSVADQLKYDLLLEGLFKSLSASAQVVELPPLSYEKQGSLRVKIANFKEICDSFNRDTEAVAKYISSQFSADTAVTDGVLSIKKSLPRDEILSAIMQYRKQYVECSSCGSMNTMIVRATGQKDQILSCDGCLAERHIK